MLAINSKYDNSSSLNQLKIYIFFKSIIYELKILIISITFFYFFQTKFEIFRYFFILSAL
ncbi:TPA: hypothetical protein DEG21_02065 [Patescibacteria group bacterium]|nr:hypothetical protein [Candidatus Gracilibacteria bacterium]HBY74668.1 hypothetical protein [Candidatus Gracilibacteria bacterium]